MQENHTQTATRSVLVLGQDIRAFLSIIRSLGRAGITVHVAMCEPDDLALKSRYVAQFHEVPTYHPGDNGWLNAITRLSKIHRYDLIIPTNDESVVPVQLHQETLREHSRPYVLNEEAFDIALDKIKSSNLAQALGLSIPLQKEIDLQHYEREQVAEFSFPLVVKPPSSFTQDDLSSRREVQHIASLEQLDNFVKRHKDWQQALLQEHFAGIGAGVEILAHRGEILFAFQHIRVHEPLDGGASSYRKSLPLNQILATATRKFIKALNYSGVAMVEYKLNTQTGQWIFIEINSRFWGSLPLAISSGANFPLYLYQYLVEGKTDFPATYRPNIYSRNLLRDLYWMTDNFNARRQSPPPTGSIPLTKVAAELGHIATGRDRIDSFALDDMKPGFAELGHICTLFWEKITSKLKANFQTIPWVRRSAAHRIKQKYGQANTVLFVCYGNICRSSFAELYALENASPGLKFLSSGFHNEAGRHSPETAILAAREFGIEMDTHRSTSIDSTLVDKSDLIFIFDQKNLASMTEQFPQAQAKTEYLGYLAPFGDIEITDPYAHDIDTFRSIYTSIAEAINALNTGAD